MVIDIEKKEDLDQLAPGYINLNNPKYIEIDGKYYAGVLIVDYYREYNEIIFRNLVNSNINMNISIFYERQDTRKSAKRFNICNRKYWCKHKIWK